MNIKERLFAIQDIKYRNFASGLIPNISRDRVIGVRIPQIRAFAKEILKSREYVDFINELPHKYLEEYHLHSFIISDIKDFDACIAELEKLFPYIDNWSVCDSLRPKCFAENKDVLISKIEEWILSSHVYTARFAIEMLMVHYLEKDFSPRYLQLVSEINAEDYYLKMMIAWYFATALTKQYDATLPYIEQKQIKNSWTHNKVIQKACESYRVSEDKKEYLRSLKV